VQLVHTDAPLSEYWPATHDVCVGVGEPAAQV
jgi:hypothetical protein